MKYYYIHIEIERNFYFLKVHLGVERVRDSRDKKEIYIMCVPLWYCKGIVQRDCVLLASGTRERERD